MRWVAKYSHYCPPHSNTFALQPPLLPTRATPQGKGGALPKVDDALRFGRGMLFITYSTLTSGLPRLKDVSKEDLRIE